jgi:hypothetical protein
VNELSEGTVEVVTRYIDETKNPSLADLSVEVIPVHDEFGLATKDLGRYALFRTLPFTVEARSVHGSVKPVRLHIWIVCRYDQFWLRRARRKR